MKRFNAPKGLRRDVDPTLSWISQAFPHLEPWRELALLWFASLDAPITKRQLQGLSLFLDRFLVCQGLPFDPNILLRKDTLLPDFFEVACPQNKDGAHCNNLIHDFLNFVLENCYSALDPGTGRKALLPAYHNPVAKRRGKNHHKCNYVPGTQKTILRQVDPTLSWIPLEFPWLERWRDLALQWLASQDRTSGNMLQSLSLFLDRFLVQEQLPTDPSILLKKDFPFPDFFEAACPKSDQGAVRNNWIRTFLAFVLEENFSIVEPTTGLKVIDPAYHNPVLRRNTRNFSVIPDRLKGVNRTTDLNFTWVKEKYPQLEDWRLLAAVWIREETLSVGVKLQTLSIFLERYIVGQGLPVVPVRFLQRDLVLPSFFVTCCAKSPGGIKSNNFIHYFLEWVLREKFSNNDGHGRLVISPTLWNPVPWKGYAGTLNHRNETNKVPLPYGFIIRLRRLLIGGQNFGDWTIAQNSLGAAIGKSGRPAPDWFPVTVHQIDMADPDCVWRVRRTNKGAETLEMWSPVRWVALALKLLLPLRTFQIRMLDSGEGDTYRYDAGSWDLNTGSLAQRKSRAPVRQGFLFRHVEPDGQVTTQLRSNTNKTADIGKSGKDLGYVFPWVVFGDPMDDVFRWVEKLRNWQEKYNPIDRLTSWTELDGTRLPQAKSAVKLASYPDTAFLFRMREEQPGSRHLPLRADTLDMCWFKLLLEFERRLEKAGETHANGSRIRLIPPSEQRGRGNFSTTNHPLHSLRVSLVTALVLDGKVPVETVSKLVGHSSQLMTIYYIVHSERKIRLSLEEAARRLEASSAASCEAFLKNLEFDELLKTAICVDPASLKIAIASAPGDRNPVGWMMMSDGCCLMGGNTSPTETNSQIGGCHNGGPEIMLNGYKGHGPVPGGPRNCIRCRWFVTMPHYFYSLVARINNLLFEKAREQELVQGLYLQMQALETERADADKAEVPFTRTRELLDLERRYEAAVGRLDVVLGNVFACLSLISRCEAELNKTTGGMGLVTAGGAAEVRHCLDDVDSELLVLTQVCEDLELYPDLPGTPDAVLRRAQILDMALMNEGFKPLFLLMTPEQQKLNGNALMRELARRADPEDPIRGRVKIVTLMDLKMNLMEHLGFGMAMCMPPGLACEPLESVKPFKTEVIEKPRRGNVIHDKNSS